ncbi:MAG: hypothetical protein CMF96_11960 [Candidatus Marinimicrobia bacterium]|nr:hypothetical protein [Candidatus Neomarinimicrobiota bacterium]
MIKHFNSYQAAEIMNVNVSTIKRWTDAKKLDCTQTAGGHRKFTLYHINEFLKRSKKKHQINIYKISDSLNEILCSHIESLDYNQLRIYFFDILLKGETSRITSILEALYLKSIPLHEIYDNLVNPTLSKIGISWYNGEITIASEHLASNTLNKAINNLNYLIINEKNESPVIVLLFGVKNNNHSLPLQMTEQIFLTYGHKVINCSANTPVFSLKELIETRNPNIILISATYIKDEDETLSEIKELKKLNKKIRAKLFIAGASDKLNSNKTLSNFTIIKSMKEVNKLAKDS